MDGSQYDAHAPAWARVIPDSPVADILIIDDDFSSLVPAIPDFGPFADYLGVYTRAVEALGYSYHVHDADLGLLGGSVVPDAATLAGYRAVIYFTGDNYLEVLSEQDMNRLTEYATSVA